MNNYTRLFIILMLIALAYLADISKAHAAWTPQDTQRELTYDSLLMLDATQTKAAMSKPGFRETNPLLGSHPSSGSINKHFAEAGIIHAAVSYLSPTIYRKSWQWGSLFIEGLVVAHNAYLGASLKF